MELIARLSPSVDTWAERLLAMPVAEATPLAHALVKAWAEGALEPRLLAARGDAALSHVRHELAATIAALEAAGFDLSVETRDLNPDESRARRWCWVTPWLLMDQDEDLLLMDDHLLLPLLEEAAAGCPKRDYALSIVAHAVRDAAHAALQAGAQPLRAYLLGAARWVEPARRARAPELAAYCERLVSYAPVQAVSAEQAAQRGRDLKRCGPPNSAPFVERKGALWRVDISPSKPQTLALTIEVASGQMSSLPWSEPSR